MRNTLTFAGVNLGNAFQLYTNGNQTYKGATRTYDPQQVPGRHGDILLHENRLANDELVYRCFIPPDNFEDDIAELRDFLLSSANVGYQRIEDTYHPDEYRLGYFEGPFEPEVMPSLQAGAFDLTFKVKPQRFLKSGEEWITYTQDSWIYNPTYNDSLPIVRAYGTGTFQITHFDVNGNAIKNNVITVLDDLVYVDIDSEIEDCYEETTNRNGDVTLTDYKFPTLIGKTNGNKTKVSFPSGTNITSIRILPRWYRL